ncbi:MAG: Dolichyl-phosphate-mannose-protein mannosyltransferase [Phycisphaerales bacterium]|nr:Dolichyl-phosphate-mannose-protein mannosyltransferase [Phycisphaerales bacterium]
MTANFPPTTAVPDAATVHAAPAPAGSGAAVDAGPSRWRSIAAIGDRVAFGILILSLLILYGLLQNPYWVPAGDSELYTAAARNMARGDGYTFNGQPIAIIPPGWSWIMSMVMRVTPYFLPLKLLAMTCMIGSLLCGYWIVRRFVSPIQALSVILLTAILSHVYQATYWLISESSFCLATSAAILIAMQIAEGRKQWWRVVLLLLLCAAAVTIRWAGVINMVLIVAVLLDKQWRPRLTTPWVSALLVIAITTGTLMAWRDGLRGTPEQVAAASDAVTGSGEEMTTVTTSDESAPQTGAADQAAKTYQLFPTGSYADRFLNWGRWFSYLYWQPFRAAGASTAIAATATTLGWVIVVLLAVIVFKSIRELRWIWLATAMYSGALALFWTNVNARYYMPIAFLITLGIFLATDQLLAWSRRRWQRVTVRTLFVLFVASVALCNAALYAVEMTIARSSRFYARYETGLNMSLISSCQYLVSLPNPPGDREVAVSPRYTNLNRTKASPFGLRAVVLLTGREIVTPKFNQTNGDPRTGGKMRAWLQSKGIKYYLYQRKISPWRVWHFRMGWYEKMQTGSTEPEDTGGWQLYRVDDEKLTQIALPRRCEPVTRVPGL